MWWNSRPPIVYKWCRQCNASYSLGKVFDETPASITTHWHRNYVEFGFQSKLLCQILNIIHCWFDCSFWMWITLSISSSIECNQVDAEFIDQLLFQRRNSRKKNHHQRVSERKQEAQLLLNWTPPPLVCRFSKTTQNTFQKFKETVQFALKDFSWLGILPNLFVWKTHTLEAKAWSETMMMMRTYLRCSEDVVAGPTIAMNSDHMILCRFSRHSSFLVCQKPTISHPHPRSSNCQSIRAAAIQQLGWRWSDGLEHQACCNCHK